MLRKSELENVDSINPLVKYITSCVADFEVVYNYEQLTNGGDAESHYLFCSSLAQDFRKIADVAFQRTGKDIVHSIAYIMATLADKFFDTYINSDYETDFSFLDELAHLRAPRHRSTLPMTRFTIWRQDWGNFEEHLHLSDKPKFKVFSDKYCDIFANQMFKALFISEPIMVFLF
ncbi:hypothetical protein RF11_11763 [Thelohanellus kitauei]|uniref:Uncharacterized protein n=1 Tax=Thelohanellus kitauei TaxID=669202 RepID=A0A0C2JPG2_THEKT|nr:hypothetical protein RF11_11763 [Thelohanellus kitauei]